jgi:hypothetical protein
MRNRLADSLPLERTWCPDEDAMLAALRVAAGLPRMLPSQSGRGNQ